MDTLVALDLDGAGGSRYYGYFLTLTTLLEIVLPTIATMLSNKIGARNTTILYFGIAVISALFLLLTENRILSILIFLMICSSRTIFNFSAGNEIIFQVHDDEKGKFFAVRDLFLYSGIALSMFAAGIAAKFLKVKYVVVIFSIILILPVIELTIFNHVLEIRKRNNVTAKDGNFLAGQLKLIKKLFAHKEFIMFLLIGMLTSVYSCCKAFLPFLAGRIGLNYQEILTLFAGVTIVNVIVSLFLGGFSDRRDKKLLYLLDIGSDFIPVIIYAFTSNVYLFYAAVLLSSLKDIFAPTTFAYKYEIFGKFEEELSRAAVAMLESLTNLICFIMPTVIGILWVHIGSGIFAIAAVSIALAVAAGLFLPKTVVSE